MLMWKLPEFDKDIFKGKSTKVKEFRGSIVHTSHEIGKLIDYLSNFTPKDKEPICTDIIKLLGKTQKFMAEPTSKDLDVMAQELEATQTLLKSRDTHSTGYQLLKDAREYCAQIINNKLQELKRSKDKILEKYHGSKLEKQMSNVSLNLKP